MDISLKMSCKIGRCLSGKLQIASGVAKGLLMEGGGGDFAKLLEIHIHIHIYKCRGLEFLFVNKHWTRIT